MTYEEALQTIYKESMQKDATIEALYDEIAQKGSSAEALNNELAQNAATIDLLNKQLEAAQNSVPEIPQYQMISATIIKDG